MNVLLTCAGRRNLLVRCFKKALGSRSRVLACDSSGSAPALVEAHKHFVVPPMEHPEYFDSLVAICREERVRLLLSVHDLELPGLAANVQRFRNVGTRAVVSSPEIVAMCQDKWAAFQWLRAHGIGTPMTYLSKTDVLAGLSAGEVAFPLLIKPRWGTSSTGIERVENERELELACEWVLIQLQRSFLWSWYRNAPEQRLIFQQWIAGEEYGLDVVNDLQGRYVATLARRKLVMRAGNTDRALSVADPKLDALGKTIGNRLQHIGPLDCDVMVKDRECYVLDLNPRKGGGYPFSHLAGANLPAALMAWAANEPVDPAWLKSTPGILVSKCDGYVIMGDACRPGETLTKLGEAPVTNGVAEDNIAATAAI